MYSFIMKNMQIILDILYLLINVIGEKMETSYSLFHYKTFWQKRKKEKEEKISAISGEKQVVKCTPACAMQAMQLATFYCCMTKQRLFFF